MTNIQIFEKVRRHLNRQGVVAKENGYCRYRTLMGLKCAVGCLIPDKHYNPNMEGNLEDLLDDFPVACAAGEFSRRNLKLLGLLQGIHDHVYDQRNKYMAALRKLVYNKKSLPENYRYLVKNFVTFV